MPTFLDLSAQLTGEIPGLSRNFAFKYINNAYQEVCRDYLWSWNIGEGVLISPSGVSTGTVTTVQGASTVTFDATAIAALTPLVLANPPLIQRQFRVGGNGPIYNILAFDSGTGIMTLDHIYGETSAGGANYTVYRVYYDPCSTDGVTPNNNFLRYLSILNPLQGYSIAGKRLYMTGEDLNRRDPLRGAIGNPYYMAAYQGRPIPSLPSAVGGVAYNQPTFGQLLYEFWPHTTTQVEFKCLYEKIGIPQAQTDYLPAQCPSTLVVYKATEYGYRWALQNMARIPELKGVPWLQMLAEVRGRYDKALLSAKRNDKEIVCRVIRPGGGGLNFLGPIDSNYAQSHGEYGFAD